MNRKGQATSELVIVLPLFVILAGGAVSVVYMSWQGLKTQQAANLAARVEGQERVMGGLNPYQINEANGFGGIQDNMADADPVRELSNTNGLVASSADREQLSAAATQLVATNERNRRSRNPSGVYGRYRQMVLSMFSQDEQSKVFLPAPKTQFVTDEVRVVRVMNPRKFFGFQMQPVVVDAKAYGGEDPGMYGLPRWGSRDPSNSGKPWWSGRIKNAQRD